MPPKPRTGPSKGGNKRSTSKPSSSSSRPSSSSSFTSKNKKTPTPKPTQHKPAPRSTPQTKKKPLHLRYTAAQLKIPQLNGIHPSGVQKLPNRKKGKKFTDDGDGMKTILALVMAEKEGDVESRMMRARQLEEVREARKAEMEARVEKKKEGLEGRKEGIRKGKKGGRADEEVKVEFRKEPMVYKARKKVSFG